MTQQRMAGGNQFKQRMQSATAGYGSDNYKTQGAHLIGGGAWDTQMNRENQQFQSAAATGSYGAANISAYANASKQATAGNNDFSINTGNKWVNNSREQSNTNKQQNEGFSGGRISGNVQYANQQQDNNLAKNEGFAQNTTNSFVNNAKDHREDNTAKATQFANAAVDKYMAKNKGNQSINVGGLDQTIRQAPINDRSYGTMQGKNTYGDMYSYGRKELPDYKQPDPMKGVEKPDFDKMGDKWRDQIEGISI